MKLSQLFFKKAAPILMMTISLDLTDLGTDFDLMEIHLATLQVMTAIKQKMLYIHGGL